MPEMIYPSRRSPVIGRGGMVAVSQPLAAAAGIRILDRGGNAADASVAIAAALNVTEPTSTGIGGDMFALYYDGKTSRISALNGSGRAPEELSIEKLSREGYGSLPPYHPYTVTVPGACAGWCDLLDAHGTLPLSVVLEPAISLAEDGFPVAPVTAHFWGLAVERQLKKSLNGLELTINGLAPRAGEVFRNPGLGKTFRRLANEGRDVFYKGEIAKAIVSTLANAGGCMKIADLARHHSTWDVPISTTYGGLRLWECPPNGQGIAALLALNLLDGFPIPEDPLAVNRLHLEIEAMRLAFADTSWFVADPARVSVPLEALLSKQYACTRRKLISLDHATMDQQRGIPTAGSDTVYFCVIDRWGNACSFINSNYMGFGTGIVPAGWGFSLQNRGHNFDLSPDHPNALAPGKRPYHTIIPAMITIPETDETDLKNNPGLEKLFAVFGVMGGFMQPQGHLQVFLSLAQGMDPQTALDLPRFSIADGSAGGKVLLEEGIPQDTVDELQRRGHPIEQVGGWQRAQFGRGQVILRNPKTGVLTGGSDLRADGCAMACL